MKKWLAKILLGNEYKNIEENPQPILGLREMIRDIIDNFDFNKVHYVMQELNWKWVDAPEGGFKSYEELENAPTRVPSIEHIKEMARARMKNAIAEALSIEHSDIDENCPYISSSGGLKATVFKDKLGRISHIGLEFILTDWESNYDEIDY